MSKEKIPKKKDLWRLYDVALSSFEYIHSDVWRGQRYYTTLNVGIIGLAFTLVGIHYIPKSYSWVVIPLFVMITSRYGYLSIKKLRKSFLEVISVNYKTLVEHLLRDELALKKADISPKHQLTPFYSLPEEDIIRVLRSPENWVRQEIVRGGGVTYYFLRLQSDM